MNSELSIKFMPWVEVSRRVFFHRSFFCLDAKEPTDQRELMSTKINKKLANKESRLAA